MSQSKPSLHSDSIDIWQIPLHGDASEQRHLLSADELQRADRFYFDRHRRRFTHARAALRSILSDYLDMAASDIQFDYNAHGKPEVQGKPQQIEFNLSHSKDWGLLAIRQEHPIGIDIEFFSPRELDKLAAYSFAVSEVETWRKLPQSQQEKAFFHIWAQKEAFIKAIGMGLAYPLAKFSVNVTGKAGFTHLDPTELDWKLHSYQPFDNAWASMCTLHPMDKINTFDYVRKKAEP